MELFLYIICRQDGVNVIVVETLPAASTKSPFIVGPAPGWTTSMLALGWRGSHSFRERNRRRVCLYWRKGLGLLPEGVTTYGPRGSGGIYTVAEAMKAIV
jgi:hypothetical protein